MENINSLKKLFYNNNKKILWLGIAVFLVIIFGFLLYKYYNYGYNAIDLGIYNQVFFNSVQGRLFEFSIHPHLYLGDHFELFIVLLLPFYAIIQSPLTLLFLQTIFIALSAWPLYLIARTKLSRNWSLFIAFAFLLNPLVLNLSFFEFHLLPFAIFFILFAFYFYYKNKFWPYLAFLVLLILIREDVSLVVIMFGLLALLEKKQIKWIITPVLLGGFWFITIFHLTGYFNQSGDYKFLSLYGWLGSSFEEIIKNFFAKPFFVIRQIFCWNNIFFVLGLLLPLAGLPILKLKYFIPCFLIFVQLFLTKISSTIALQTHYPALIIPFLFIAAVFSLSGLLRNDRSLAFFKSLILKQKGLFFIILFTAVIYSFFTFGPIPAALNNLFNNKLNENFIAVKNEMTQLINKDETVLSSFEFLPPLSNRQNIYSLHYVFLGKKQFSEEIYELPSQVNKLIIDFNDFIIYYLQSKNMSIFKKQYPTGADRIKQIISEGNFGIKQITDNIALYEKNYNSDIVLIEENATASKKINQVNASLDKNLFLLGWEKINYQSEKSNNIVPLSFYWQTQQKIINDYQLELTLKNNKKIVYQKLYPLGYGLYPTSQWPINKKIKTNHWFLIPKKYNLKDYQLYFQVVAINGYMNLDGVRSAKMEITEKNYIGQAILIRPLYFESVE
jgi:uncharacterized membrane protein